MNEVNRTANCTKCGGVLFRIKPSVGCFTYYCAACNNKVVSIQCDKYETVLPDCEECGGDTFKVRITVDEQDSTHYWKPECIKSNCEGTLKHVYVDKDGNLIAKDIRELYIAKDNIKSLEEEVNIQKETIEELERKVDDLNNEIDEKDNLIYHSKDELDTSIDELDTSKRNISELENRISELEWDIRRSK